MNKILQGSVFDRINDVPDGGQVLDIFAGSGSTNVAAAHLGLECIGIELSEEYAETAKARIREALEDQQTFKF